MNKQAFQLSQSGVTLKNCRKSGVTSSNKKLDKFQLIAGSMKFSILPHELTCAYRATVTNKVTKPSRSLEDK